MAHNIRGACNGCCACNIDIAKCIDYRVCGMICTKTALLDQNSEAVPRAKITDRVKLVVDVKDCSACFIYGESLDELGLICQTLA